MADLLRVVPVARGLSILRFGTGACLIEPARCAFSARISAAVASTDSSSHRRVPGCESGRPQTLR